MYPLAGLELAMYSRLALNSKRLKCLALQLTTFPLSLTEYGTGPIRIVECSEMLKMTFNREDR